MGLYEPRLYRLDARPEKLVAFKVEIKESDLLIFAEKNLKKEALKELEKVRDEIESWISIYPEFYSSLVPLPLPPRREVPAVVREMYEAARVAGVGPMAAVAGAVAAAVGRKLLQFSCEVIVENGGDIFCFSLQERYSLVYAGSSPFSENIAVKIPAGEPLGICTSSGTIGHSLSFGRADAVVVVDSNAALADAAATAIGNVVRGPDDIEKGLKKAVDIGVRGVLIILGDRLGVRGDIELKAI